MSTEFTINENLNIDSSDFANFEPKKIKLAEFIKRNPICHSSSMIRVSALKDVDNYNEQRAVLFDYDLWVRLLKRNHEFAKIDLPLVFKRLHSKQNFERKNRPRYLWEATKLKLIVKQSSDKHLQGYFFIFISFIYGLIPISIRKKIINKS